MKKLSLITAILAVSLMAAGCSNTDDDIKRQWEDTFMVQQSVPGNGSVNVDQSTPITIYFTENLMYGQISEQCYSVQRLDSVTKTPETVTGIAAPIPQGNMLTFNPPIPLGKWNTNSTYQINLNQCIKSIEGDMLFPAQIIFSTGLATNQVSVAGKPRITYMNIENNTGDWRDCIAVRLTFNETITNGLYLYASVQIEMLWGSWTVGTYQLYPMNFYYPYGDGMNFWLIFPYDSNGTTSGCDGVYYQAGQKLTIRVSGAVDLDGERMDPKEEHFWAFQDYFCVSSYCSY